ncbi:MAG TPA: polysaccharide deacetylase family protein [Xanthobacteraceae bacterium]|jgi:peptidoglycan/xylan/chitin deacetylase (PgdA/CDA1 family)
MRAAIFIGGLAVAGCLGALGVVEAQKFAITATIWPALTGSHRTTTASAPAETTPARPQAPRQVVTDLATQADAAPAPATGGAATRVAAAPSPQPAPAAPAATPAAATAAAPAAAQGPAPLPMPKLAPIACNNPNALGISRVVQIDTTGGPGFGTEHFKSHDFLNDHEVVLTFDDGPWLNNTPMVLKALADQCVRATFFPIGKHSTYYPEILKKVAEAGHTVGSHTWSHADLTKKTLDESKTEIEMAISAVHAAVGAPTSPFFRFPSLRHPPEVVTYLGERNIAIFSTDIDSFDFKIHKPEQVVKSVMDKLAKHGKGIILMHDFQQATAHAMPALLAALKAGGYKIVHMTAKDQLTTLAQYDEMLLKQEKLPTLDQRPTSSVVRTISE